MEYQYQLDPSTGTARAIFSLEHEIFGPWLEVEIGSDIDKFTQVLTALDQVIHGKSNEKLIVGSEYTLIIDQEDVSIQPNVNLNGGLNGKEGIPEALSEQGLMLGDDVSSCGLEDFRELIVSWSHFIKK